MGIISKEIGVDLGTSNVRIHVKGRGIVLTEPSVIAINKITNNVLAVGTQAKEMIGRTPDNIIALKPIKGGVIADFDSTKNMMQEFISRVIPKKLFSKTRMVVTIPSDITDVEERAVEGVAYKAGAKDVYLMEEVMAAAIGSGINVAHAEGSMIVDLGSGTSEFAVLSLGGIVTSSTTKIAGDKLDLDIVDYVKQNFNVIIGIGEAEYVKKEIAAAKAAMTEERISIKGRNLATGLPQTVVLTTTDVNNAIIDTLYEIVNVLKMTLEKTPPEIASDIMENGIVICGGGALIKNLDRFISDEIGMPVFIAENPLECVARGVGKALDSIEILKKAVKTKRNR